MAIGWPLTGLAPPGYPTLEFRIADSCPRLDDVAVRAAEAVGRLFDHVRPALEADGDLDAVVDGTAGLVRRGTSAAVQRLVLANGGGLAAVTAALAAQTREG